MSFEYPVCTREMVDIEGLTEKWNQSPDIVNHLHKQLTHGEYALINFIVNEGLKDILGQQPADDNPIEDDPFAKPNPDYGISLPIFDDDDPFARPIQTPDESDDPDLEEETE